MKQFTLKVSRREGVGRGPSRRVRRSGGIPAVLYGKINPPCALSVDAPEFTVLMKKIGGSAAVVELKEGDADVRLSVIQEIQRDPMTDRVLHIDLHEVSANEEMEISVTVHPMGESHGVRVENGILEIVSHEVRVRCLPKDLPAFIEVDVRELHVNHSIHVKELPAIPGVRYVDDPNRPVIACVEPVVEVEAVAAPGAAIPGTAEAAAAPAAAGAPATPAAAPAAAAKK